MTEPDLTEPDLTEPDLAEPDLAEPGGGVQDASAPVSAPASSRSSLRFSSSAALLHATVAAAAQVTPRVSDRPVNMAVELSVSSGTLTACGTDGETYVSASQPAGSPSSGSVLVAPKALLGYLGTLPGDLEVTVSLSDAEHLYVTAPGRSSYLFRPVSGSFTRPPGGRMTLVPARFDLLARALRLLAPAVNREHSGVQLVSSGDVLTLNATDNYRLSSVGLPGAGFGEFSVVLPLQVLELVARQQLSSAAVDAKGSLVRFASDTVSVVSRTLAVPFPATEGLLASRGRFSQTLPAVEVKAALRPLELVASGRPVRVGLDGDTVTLSASNLEVGEGSERVSCRQAASGPPFSFQVSAEYLRDVFSSSEAGDTVTLWWDAPDRPLHFTSEHAPASDAARLSSTAVVMPQSA